VAKEEQVTGQYLLVFKLGYICWRQLQVTSTEG